MVTSKNVIDLIDPLAVTEGAGVRLKRSIGTPRLDYLDPFLLFDHFGSDDPDDYLAGFPMHPHRGIETVTYILNGKVNHEDSLGNSGTIKSGDIQWMTSGSGILHEEMPKPVDNKMEGFQLWINLPSNLKMSKPRYQDIKSSKIPEIRTKEDVKIRIIAGAAYGVLGAVNEIYADPEYFDVHMPESTSFKHPINNNRNAFIYVYDGEGTVGEGDNKIIIKSPQMAVLGYGDILHISTLNKSMKFLMATARPLKESIARYGPFVMNTAEEIEEALEDLRNGTFVK